MDRPTLYRGDGYLPDAIFEATTGNLHDLIPKLESAARLGLDIELTTERTLEGGQNVLTEAVRRRFRLRVFPKQADSDARECLANIALQRQRRQDAFEELLP